MFERAFGDMGNTVESVVEVGRRLRALFGFSVAAEVASALLMDRAFDFFTSAPDSAACMKMSHSGVIPVT